MVTQTETKYQAYSGRNVDQMPIMLARGVVPLTSAGFFQNREAIMEQLGDVYIDTSDLVAYGGKKQSDEIKMILTVDNQGKITENGRKSLELISPSQERTNGAIVLSNEFYDGLNHSGVVPLSRKDLKKYGIDGDLTEAQVLNHPVWKVLLRHPDAVPAEFAYDTGFMQETVSRTFAEMNKRHNYTKGMGVYPDSSEKAPKLRAWYVDGLRYGSGAYGRILLVDGSGHLVGVAPEVQSASAGFTSPSQVENKSETRVESYTPSQISKALKSAKLQGIESIILEHLRN